MVKDKDLEEFAHSKYWDERYTSKHKLDDNGKPVLDSNEWSRDFQELRPFLETHLPAPNTACQILHLGCGNSVNLVLLSILDRLIGDFLDPDGRS